MNFFPFDRLKPHDRPDMFTLVFRLALPDLPVIPSGDFLEVFVKEGDKIVVEVYRHAAAVVSAITDDGAFFGDDFDEGAFIKGVHQDIRTVGLREGKAELGSSFCGGYFGCDIVISQIDPIIIRLCDFGLMRKP